MTRVRIAVFCCFLMLCLSRGVHSKDICPQRDYELKVWKNVVPLNWKNAGNYTKNSSGKGLISCLESCCNDKKCDAILLHKTSCFLITCKSDEACQPKQNLDETHDVSIVLVRSADKRQFYEELNEYDDQLYSPVLSKFEHRRKDNSINPLISNDDAYSSTEEIMTNAGAPIASSSESSVEATVAFCTSDADCDKNAFCFKEFNTSKSGECFCRKGYTQNTTNSGQCVPNSETRVVSNDVGSKYTANVAKTVPPTTTEAPTARSLVVAAENKTIQLPENSVSISAFAFPESKEYAYQWTLVNHPSGEETGQMQKANTANLKLTQLRQGVYTLQVTVTGKKASGSALVTVTVVPPQRVNKPPIVIIQPSNSTVQLPNKDTVLEGSASYDDDKVVSYKWEPVTVPINYKAPLGLEMNTSTLQLRNLSPGFFQYKLTVTDSDGATNSTVANITVFKETDYPPTANAGPDVIIHLPQNEVTLNGNTSTDDKGIVSWLWMRSPDDNKGKAVDMDGTTTPYLHLSKLELGVYKFALKVMDTANQSSMAEVHVFVKPETNTAPTANAGENKQVSLPLETPIILDGSKSKDASPEGIVKWHWNQTSGPKPSILLNASEPRTQVTGLIPGVYTFMLSVVNAKGIAGSAKVNVTVTQTKNLPPIAIAGGEQVVTLPCSIVSINGSNSKDDIAIVSYKWTREPGSLAAGNIVGNTDDSPILQLVDLVVGRYLFRLTVADAQGATGSDVAALIVKPSPNLNDEIEITLNIDISSFTEDQEMNTVKKLELLLNDAKSEQLKLANIRLTPETVTNRVVVMFSVETVSGKRVPGPEAVQKLKQRLKTDPNLINPQILNLETVICQNNCSNHGSCDQYSKRCICEAFWMEDMFRVYFGDKETNCDWSILYVIIIAFTSILLLCIIFWSIVCFLTKRPTCKLKGPKLRKYRRHRNRRPANSHRYTLLQNNCNDAESSDLNDFDVVNNLEMSVPRTLEKKINFTSDSDDSDSDLTLFDSSTRNNMNNAKSDKINTKNCDASVKYTTVNKLVKNDFKHKVKA